MNYYLFFGSFNDKCGLGFEVGTTCEVVRAAASGIGGSAPKPPKYLVNRYVNSTKIDGRNPEADSPREAICQGGAAASPDSIAFGFANSISDVRSGSNEHQRNRCGDEVGNDVGVAVTMACG